MRIGITINQVLRDFLEKLQLTYEKYSVGDSPILDIEEIVDITKLKEYFPITNQEVTQSLDKFIYTDAAMEILGSARIIDMDFMEAYSEFIYDFLLFPENKISFISQEFDRGINATLFFLAKTNIQVRNIEFVDTYKNIWDNYDVIITAEPSIIESKPKDKRVIKVNCPYNKEVIADETVDMVSEAFKYIRTDE